MNDQTEFEFEWETQVKTTSKKRLLVGEYSDKGIRVYRKPTIGEIKEAHARVIGMEPGVSQQATAWRSVIDLVPSKALDGSGTGQVAQSRALDSLRVALDDMYVAGDISPQIDPLPRTLFTESELQLGKIVREVWVWWAKRQPDISDHPNWLTPWEELSPRDREVDIQIASAIKVLVVHEMNARIEKLQDDVNIYEEGLKKIAEWLHVEADVDAIMVRLGKCPENTRIRCRDCRYMDAHGDHCGLFLHAMHDEDFCSRWQMRKP